MAEKLNSPGGVGNMITPLTEGKGSGQPAGSPSPGGVPQPKPPDPLGIVPGGAGSKK